MIVFNVVENVTRLQRHK